MTEVRGLLYIYAGKTTPPGHGSFLAARPTACRCHRRKSWIPTRSFALALGKVIVGLGKKPLTVTSVQSYSPKATIHRII